MTMYNLSDEQIKMLKDNVQRIEGRNISSSKTNAFKKPFHFNKQYSSKKLQKISTEEVRRAETSGNMIRALKQLTKLIYAQSEADDIIQKGNTQFRKDMFEIESIFLRNPLISPLIPNIPFDTYNRIAYFIYSVFIKPTICKFDGNYYINNFHCYTLISKESISEWIPQIQCRNEQGIIMPYSVPCSSSEKQALLRLILSDFSPFKIPVYIASMPIVYGSVVDAIHSNIIDYVTNEVSIFANANGDPVKTATGLDSVRSRLTHIFYHQPYYRYLYAKQRKANLIIKCNEYLGNISPRKKYNLLFSLLDTVCTSSISTLQSLAILLAKIYCGRNFMKHTSITGNNATIIISTNSEFIRNLLFHIIKGISTLPHRPLSRMINAFDYAQSVVTEHSVNDLSSASNIIKLINDKLCGNIVNIDTTKQNTVPQQAKDIIIGKTVKIDDEVVGKITYRSNAHFIFLRQTEDKKLLEELNGIADVIDLSDSTLDQYIYSKNFQLEQYEIFFLTFGLVTHGIELMLDDTKKVTIPTQELDVQEFANKYLEFSAAQEEASTDSSPLKETEPTVSQEGRKKDPTPFIHVDILFSHYSDFQKLSGKRPCTRSAFNSQIMKLFPKVNYKKKNTILANGERKDAMAFIGLKFNEAQFAEELKKLQDNPQTSENTKEEFISYLEKIINDYHQFASYELENISPKTNQ